MRNLNLPYIVSNCTVSSANSFSFFLLNIMFVRFINGYMYMYIYFSFGLIYNYILHYIYSALFI